jgi:hypothetical protein
MSNNNSNINMYNDVITNLQDYTLTSKNISKIYLSRLNLFKPEKPKNITYKSNYKLLVPEHTDQLFWIFYIIKYGIDEYKLLGNSTYQIEKEIKFKYINIIKNNKIILKNNKIKKMYECEDELLNCNKISFKTFFALCVLENINIYYLQKRTYFKYTNNDDDNYHVIHNINENNNGYEVNVTDDILLNYETVRFKRDNYDTFLKPLSSYKLNDIIEICEKFHIPITINGKNKKKNDLYNDIKILLLL